MRSSSSCEKLLQDNDIELDESLPQREPLRETRRRRFTEFLLGFSLVVNVLLFVYLMTRSSSTCINPQLLYCEFILPVVLNLLGPETWVPFLAPAQDVVEYEVIKFRGGLFNSNEEPDIYSNPPSDEVDAAWEDLYNVFGISAIPRESAVLLPNETIHVPGDKSHYLVGLDVFHQLHCLNRIRKALYPVYYPPDEREDAETRARHLSHCVNSIRQSIQCSSDISAIVFEEDTRPLFEIVHSCRNFTKIREWAIEHRARISKPGKDSEMYGHA
uniref:Tat pathway signal sequence n=1 Tax=Moniliophthora roreri TaxID=221103 RepID=A0A0W0G7V4_MONRR